MLYKANKVNKFGIASFVYVMYIILADVYSKRPSMLCTELLAIPYVKNCLGIIIHFFPISFLF
jgi:hypothetical protein